MSFTIVPVGSLSFTGRKGRKRLCPLTFTFAFDGLGPPPPPNGRHALRVVLTAINGVALVDGAGLPIDSPGPFQIQVVDGPSGTWLPVAGIRNSVQSTATFTGIFSQTTTAFASYLVPDDGSPNSITDNADFVIAIIDTQPNAPNGGLITSVSLTGPTAVPVTALISLNKSVLFLLDRTSSMRSSGRFTRLKAAVKRGLGLFTNNDLVGAVSLDHVTAANPSGGSIIGAPLALAGKTAAGTACQNLAFDASNPKRVYQTSINFAHGQDPTGSATVLIVTDGVTQQQLTTFPSIAQTLSTSALFLETPSDSNAYKVCSTNGGVSAVSSAGTNEFTIEKLLSQILIDLGGFATVLDPDDSLSHNETRSFPLSLNETDREVTAILFSDQPELLKIALVGPGLLPITRDLNDDYEPESNGFLLARAGLAPFDPDAPRDHQGNRVVVSHAVTDESLPCARASFTVLAVVQSDLLLDAFASASGLEVGADLLFSVRLTEYALPVQHRKDISVHVELRHPDGGVEEVSLPESSPGHFEASRRAFRPGLYLVHFIATGRTLLQHRRFRREALRSVTIFECGATSCCPPYQSPDPPESE